MLRVMTPLLGTKTHPRPSGTSRVGTQEPPGRCFPARCGAAWGGYGAAWAGAVPRAGNTACWVFTNHETRIKRHGFYAFLPTISHHFPRFPGISRPPTPPPPIKCPRAVRLSWSAARECRPRPVAAFLRVVARHGRHGAWGAPSRCPRTVRTSNRAFRVFTKPETRDTRHGYCQARRAGCPLGQREFRGFHESRNTRHETRLLCFPAHDFPAFPAISR